MILSRRNLTDLLIFGLLPRKMRIFSETSNSKTLFEFGAKGIGKEFDDGPAIQAAIDEAWRRGGGTVIFPAPPKYYHTQKKIICRPNVSLIGVCNPRPRLVMHSQKTSLLLAGNFHPDFIGKADYHDIAYINNNEKYFELSIASEGSLYSLGDQIFVTSVTWGDTGGFPIPHHGYLSTITKIDGCRLHFSEEINFSGNAKVALLKNQKGRNNIDLFFYMNSEISGLQLESEYHIMDDSAMLNVRISNNIFIARSAIYGNAFQHVNWRNNKFFFSRALGEMSMNSICSLATDNEFIFNNSQKDLEVIQGFYFQEYGSNLKITNSTVHFGNANCKNFLVSISNAREIEVSDIKFIGNSAESCIYMGSKGDLDFHLTGNEVKNCSFTFNHINQAITVNGLSSEFMYNNYITECEFHSKVSKGRLSIYCKKILGIFMLKRNKFIGGSRIESIDSGGLVLVPD